MKTNLQSWIGRRRAEDNLDEIEKFIWATAPRDVDEDADITGGLCRTPIPRWVTDYVYERARPALIASLVAAACTLRALRQHGYTINPNLRAAEFFVGSAQLLSYEDGLDLPSDTSGIDFFSRDQTSWTICRSGFGPDGIGVLLLINLFEQEGVDQLRATVNRYFSEPDRSGLVPVLSSDASEHLSGLVRAGELLAKRDIPILLWADSNGDYDNSRRLTGRHRWTIVDWRGGRSGLAYLPDDGQSQPRIRLDHERIDGDFLWLGRPAS